MQPTKRKIERLVVGVSQLAKTLIGRAGTYIGVRAREEDGQSVALVEGHHVLVVLVGGIVLQDNVSAPPSWLLSVEQLYQRLKVEFHHGGVGIGLY